MINKYHLIMVDFETFNMEDFDKERKKPDDKNYKGVVWDNSKTHQDFALDDKVYMCYFNLPDGCDRILMRCSVIKAAKSPITHNVEEFTLKFEKGIKSKDKNQYSKDNLSKKYGISIFRGKQYLHEDNKQQNKLINDLEEDLEKEWLTMSELKKYFSSYSDCALKDCKGLDGFHQSFVTDNGFKYYEEHHLVEKNNIDKKTSNNIENIVNNPINIFHLCPICHKMIHYGKKAIRKEMVTYLYNQNTSGYDFLLKDVSDGNSLTGLLKQYGVDDTKK